MGNVIFTPHPVTLEGQRRESLVPGETVRELLVRVAPEAPPEEWQVHVDGNPVRPEEYDHVRPPEGAVIEVRGIVQRQMLAIVAIAALTYFTFGGGSIAGWSLGTATAGGTAMVQAVTFMAGPAMGGRLVR